jgi:hypothetical protein
MMFISDVGHQRINMQCEYQTQEIKNIYRKLTVMNRHNQNILSNTAGSPIYLPRSILLALNAPHNAQRAEKLN